MVGIRNSIYSRCGVDDVGAVGRPIAIGGINGSEGLDGLSAKRNSHDRIAAAIGRECPQHIVADPDGGEVAASIGGIDTVSIGSIAANDPEFRASQIQSVRGHGERQQFAIGRPDQMGEARGDVLGFPHGMAGNLDIVRNRKLPEQRAGTLFGTAGAEAAESLGVRGVRRAVDAAPIGQARRNAIGDKAANVANGPGFPGRPVAVVVVVKKVLRVFRLLAAQRANMDGALPVDAFADKSQITAIGRPLGAMIVIENFQVAVWMGGERRNATCVGIESPEARSGKTVPLLEREPFGTLKSDLAIIRRPGKAFRTGITGEAGVIGTIYGKQLRLQQGERTIQIFVHTLELHLAIRSGPEEGNSLAVMGIARRHVGIDAGPKGR